MFISFRFSKNFPPFSELAQAHWYEISIHFLIVWVALWYIVGRSAVSFCCTKISLISSFFSYFLLHWELALPVTSTSLRLMCYHIKKMSIKRTSSVRTNCWEISECIHALFWHFHQKWISDEALSSRAWFPPPPAK